MLYIWQTNAVCSFSFLKQPCWKMHQCTYSRMVIPRFIGPNLWNSVSVCMRNHFHRWIGHHRVVTLTPLKISRMCWVNFTEWIDSPIVNIRSQTKMNATLDGNKCYDIASSRRNNATMNAHFYQRYCSKWGLKPFKMYHVLKKIVEIDEVFL